MSDEADVKYIGILGAIFDKLAEEERAYVMALTSRATAATRQLQELEQILSKTQMCLAAVVKEHGQRSADDKQATLQLSYAAFDCLKGNLESWEEPGCMVMRYSDDADAGGDGSVSDKEGQSTPPPAKAERTPN